MINAAQINGAAFFLYSSDYLLEPIRKRIRFLFDFSFYFVQCRPAVTVGFGGVGQGCAVPFACIYMVYFVFDEAIVELGGVVE